MVKEITLEQIYVAEEQIRLLRKQVEYDTKDFTLELLLQKYKNK